MNTRRRQLLGQYKCNPIGTFILPVVTQLPLFFCGSVVLSHLSGSPTPFDSESFLTLTSLSHVDPTTTLPIVLGLITLANVDSSSWFMTKAQRHRKSIADAKFEKSVEAGEISFGWERLIKPGLRFASIVRILIASMVPGVGHRIINFCLSPLISLLECCSLLGIFRNFRSTTNLGI